MINGERMLPAQIVLLVVMLRVVVDKVARIVDEEAKDTQPQ